MGGERHKLKVGRNFRSVDEAAMQTDQQQAHKLVFEKARGRRSGREMKGWMNGRRAAQVKSRQKLS